MFPDLVGDAAILVNDGGLICTMIDRCRGAVCVEVSGSFGSIRVVSVYCRKRKELGSYLRFMDTMLALAGSTPVVLGLDANAVSSLWYSKMPVNAHRYPMYSRGIVLGEWLVARGLGVLNVP